MDAVDARLATTADLHRVASTLGGAFHDDPVVSHVLPQGVRGREPRVRGFMGLAARQALGAGSLWTTSGHEGAAAWLPPGRWRARPRDVVRLMPRAAWALRGRMVLGSRCMNAVEEHHPAEPHWYLEAVGTDPSARGAGHGAAVIEPVLGICDRDGVAAYLESSKDVNVPYYERFGFRVTGEFALPDGGPTLWAMWRDPR